MEQDKKHDKANWDASAARFFCEICAKETLDGNRPTAFLSPTGYRNLELEFFKQTRITYTRKQFKNRWDAMRAQYLACKHFKQRATGIGWDDEKKAVTIDDDWWKETDDKLCDGFRQGPPEFMDELETMFTNAHVDEKSSLML